MKTKLLIVALFTSAGLIASANAGGHHGGGSGGGYAGGGPGMSRGGGSYHSMSGGRFGGSRMGYSGQRFSSSVGMRSSAFQPHYGTYGGAPVRARQFTSGNISHANGVTRSSNTANRSGNFTRQGNNVRQARNGNANLRSDWRNHVYAQRSANWHRDWDRGRDHWWHGHRCHYYDGSWVIFDAGFYPWWWSDWYPYYGYGYYGYPYPYDYDPGYYEDNEDNQGDYKDRTYGQNSNGDESADSTVAAVQDRLARSGCYRGQIDGVLGPRTRAAIARYQSGHGLNATGYLNRETLAALHLREVASY